MLPLLPLLPVLPPVPDAPDAPPLRERVAPAVLPSVGNSPAWLLATAACAARRRAAAWAMLWLPVAACCCRRLWCSSPDNSPPLLGPFARGGSAGRPKPGPAAPCVGFLYWARAPRA